MRMIGDVLARRLQGVIREIVCNAPSSMALLDESARHVAASPEYCARLMIDRDAILGKTHEEIVSALPEGWLEARNRALAGTPSSCEGDWPLSEVLGKLHTAWVFQPWKRSSAGTSGVIVFVDADAVPAQTSQMHWDSLAIFDRAPVVVLLASVGGKIVFLNALGRRLAGIATLQEACEHTLSELEYSDTGIRHLSSPAREAWTGELELRNTATGEHLPVLMSTFAIGARHASFSNFACIGVPAPLHGSGRGSSFGLRERYAEAERILAAGNIVDTIARELKDNLSIINAYSSVLMSEFRLDRPIHSKIEAIREAAERSQKLSGQLLMLRTIWRGVSSDESDEALCQ